VIREVEMARHGYRIFSEGQIGNLTLPNRLVRSATWDPCILKSRRMTDEVVDLYGELAAGGVGMIITGGFPVVEKRMLGGADSNAGTYSYHDIHVKGIDRLVEAVHRSGTGCKVVAQLENGYLGAGPSAIPSPFQQEPVRPLRPEEIGKIIECFIEATVMMRECGCDGVQLHAAHGGLLSRFLSPYANRRDDDYGDSVANRARIVREIVEGARDQVGDFPIQIKINCTDYVEGGLGIDNFPELAGQIERAGVDAIEVSGGMWDCLVRSERELGFRPVPAPESHTRIDDPGSQSYFLKYAEQLDLGVPVILVGGNRDVERLEEIISLGKADFIALCRPMICEPNLPNRWLAGTGGRGTECISCNACIYSMLVHPGRDEPGLVTCVYKRDKEQFRMAQEWLASWVENNAVR
jgi:2,4-dienoyl-CoA reductase-like NADH-dependent reductase (Old Yellow Enzyme family)